MSWLLSLSTHFTPALHPYYSQMVLLPVLASTHPFCFHRRLHPSVLRVGPTQNRRDSSSSNFLFPIQISTPYSSINTSHTRTTTFHYDSGVQSERTHTTHFTTTQHSLIPSGSFLLLYHSLRLLLLLPPFLFSICSSANFNIETTSSFLINHT